MTRLILTGLLVVSMVPLAFGQSNFYKMRNGNSVTIMGQSLIQSTATLCAAFAELQGHFNAMTAQRNSVSDYTLVSEQWGVLDPATNAISETHADGLYQEINSMVGNAGPSVTQFCSRVKQ